MHVVGTAGEIGMNRAARHVIALPSADHPAG